MLKSNNTPSYIKSFIIVFVISLIVAFLYKYDRNTKSIESNDVQVVSTSNISPKVLFKNIQNGDTLISPITLEMGIRDMIIKPAGAVQSGTGHHHVIIDGSFIKFGQIVPMDTQHLHYGKGDSVVEIELSPGPHNLTLQFANGMHMSYGEQFSNSINIYIK
jgi:hypothetical protein